MHGATFITTDFGGGSGRTWGIYVCSSCGGVVLAHALGTDQTASGVMEFLPAPQQINAAIP